LPQGLYEVIRQMMRSLDERTNPRLVIAWVVLAYPAQELPKRVRYRECTSDRFRAGRH
jgi:hypothetical protein